MTTARASGLRPAVWWGIIGVIAVAASLTLCFALLTGRPGAMLVTTVFAAVAVCTAAWRGAVAVRARQ